MGIHCTVNVKCLQPVGSYKRLNVSMAQYVDFQLVCTSKFKHHSAVWLYSSAVTNLCSNSTFPQIPQPVNFCHCCLYISDNERKELRYINLEQVSLLYRQCVIGKRVSCNTDLFSWHCFLWLKKIAQTHTPIFHCPWLEVADAMSKDKQHQQKVTPPFFSVLLNATST